MATQFSELQKLLINVAPGKCDAFINAHINNTWPVGDNVERPSELPEFKAGENDKFFNKVVFLQKYNAIYTKGTFFGYSGDLKASFDDLVEVLTTGATANGITIKYNPDATNGPAIETTVVAAEYDTEAKTWKNIDNVITGSNVKTYVDAQVAGAVAEATAAMNFRGPITADNFTTKQSEASNGDVYVVSGTNSFTLNGETFEVGDLVIFSKDGDAAATYTVVERNLDGAIIKDGDLTASKIVVASGTDKVKTTDYGIGSDDTAYTAFGSTYTLATEKATVAYVVGKLGELDANVTYTANVNNYVSYTYTQTNGLVSDVTVGLKIAEYTYTPATESELSTFTYNTYGLIDHNILNDYAKYVNDRIDAIDCEVTTLTEVSDSDYFSVTEDSTDKTDNDRNYKIELNVVNLGDAVGMTYDEATGKWSAPEGSNAVNGLASAADVANELVSDEKVIAAALNDHEARLDVLEAFADDINGTIQDQLVIGDVTVTGLTAKVEKPGLVDAQLLMNVINALDPWEDYE